MAWFEHRNSRIYYEDEGSGEPLLLLPGWSGSIGDLLPVRQALAPHYGVIEADPPGSGQSGPHPREYSASYYEDDSYAFLALLEGSTHHRHTWLASAMAANMRSSWAN
jgi:pimeloyl-ACP methyl ester carboxylesterase